MTETPNPHIIDADTLTGEMRPIRRAVLALGSNLGDRLSNLQGAVDTLGETPDLFLVAGSPVYESSPVDSPVQDADDFLNAVLLVDTTLPADVLLERCLAVEDAYSRERGERNAPRTLDIDLIVLGDKVLDEPELSVPHPRAHERAFVLQPWYDVDPGGQLPGHGPIRDLLRKVDVSDLTRRSEYVLDLT